MTLPDEIEAQIRRLHHAEHWPVGTIAAQLGIHHDAIRRVLKLDVPRTLSPRPRATDPFVAFLAATLQQYPTVPTVPANVTRTVVPRA